MGGRAAPGARSFRLALYLILALIFNGEVEAAEKLRLAIQKTGTFAWELEIIKARGLDRRAGLDLEVRELASPEAAKIALNGAAADLILSDWLWVSRERGLGHPLVFVPHSTTHGALMVGPKSTIEGLSDLIGRRLAIAGGPLDKSWLLLQALALESGLDLKTETETLYGAPALLYAKALSGEADVALTFWNYCIALEARGFRSLISVDEVARRLGAKGPFAMVGYVFDERFARQNPETIKKFLTITAEAKAILVTSDADWARIMPRIGTSDPAELALYRKAYVAGIPRRPIEEEEADARALYARLAEIGGPELVGSAKVLDPGTFYHSDTRPAPAEN